MSVRASTWAWERGREQGLNQGQILTLVKVADHADNDGVCWPGEKHLAEYTSQGETTVRGHLKQLEGMDLLHRERRTSEKGRGRARDHIHLHLDQPADPAGEKATTNRQMTGDQPADDGGRTNKGTVKNPHGRVGKKPVSDDEYSLATSVVAAFNETAGTSLSVDPHLTPIVGRIRERPALTAAQHRKIIEAVFAAEHWWTGPPSPRVIYGNAAQFEQSIEIARHVAAGKGKRKVDPLSQEATRALMEREAEEDGA